MASASPAVLYEKKGHKTYLTLDRPESRNQRDEAIATGLIANRLSIATQDFTEGQAAVREGRKPQWKGH